MDLTWCIFLPLITAAVILFIPSGWKGMIKLVSVIGALLTFVLSIGLVRGYRDEVNPVGEATEELAIVQEQILTGTFAGQPKPDFGLEALRTGAQQSKADLLAEWKKRFLPAAGSSQVFTESEHAAARDRVRALAAGVAAKDPEVDADALADDAEVAWGRALELQYALGSKQTQHMRFTEFTPWIPLFNVNYFLGVDGLSLPLVWLTALLTLLCLVYSWSIDKGTKGYYVLFLLLETGLIGVFCALDFFLFYVFTCIVIDLILHILCLGAAILLIARALPGVYVDSYGTAILVAVVYGLINVTLGTVLKLIGLPFVILTLGVFLIIINTFLLWLTDKFLDDFEIEDLGTTFIAALLITIADTVLMLVF